MADIVVGRFRLIDRNEFEGGMIEGPADYMADKGNALLDSILAGNDVMFNMTAHLSPTVELAVLVRLQTDYAGYAGNRQLINAVFGKSGYKGDMVERVS